MALSAPRAVAYLLAAGAVACWLALPATARAGVISQPTGQFAGKPARGAVMVIHGGAWIWTGPAQVFTVERQARRFSDAGFITDNIDYRPARRSVEDSVAEYDKLRAQLGKHTPICVWGQSAGGYLALMIAVRRRDVACVISEAGPTDLATDTGLLMASNFFFARYGGLARWSPVSYADRMRASLLLVGATNDALVPLSQAREFARMRPRDTRVFVLHPGTAPWVHGQVDAADLALLHRTERAMAIRCARRYLSAVRRPVAGRRRARVCA